MDVFPDFGGVGGAADLRSIVGALLMFVLVTAVLMLIVCAIIWAISGASGTTRQRPRPAPACLSRSAPPRYPVPALPGSTSCWTSAPGSDRPCLCGWERVRT